MKHLFIYEIFIFIFAICENTIIYVYKSVCMFNLQIYFLTAQMIKYRVVYDSLEVLNHICYFLLITYINFLRKVMCRNFKSSVLCFCDLRPLFAKSFTSQLATETEFLLYSCLILCNRHDILLLQIKICFVPNI